MSTKYTFGYYYQQDGFDTVGPIRLPLLRYPWPNFGDEEVVLLILYLC